ncbi:MAG: glycosyltransferase family 2 protein [Acidobacteria bacterium]|nr:glycosyltransferase family 2 protein [Acidobacteriota bacterium]
MQLDLILPTYNRCTQLPRVFESIRDAMIPADLNVQVLVVDNHSTDQTAHVVADETRLWGGRMRYLLEPQQGKSFALNTAIQRTSGELIGIFDDDQEMDAGWFNALAEAFKQTELDFISGPVKPRWDFVAVPAWLPQSYRAVIGWVDGGDQMREFGKDYEGIMTGGNSVFRRSVVDRIGLYDTRLGRTNTNLIGGEDQDFHERMMAAGCRGQYRPDLIMHFQVAAQRLTKAYYRNWCHWNAVSLGVMDRARPKPMPYFLGVPRYMFAHAVTGLLEQLKAPFTQSNPSALFTHELAVRHWLGYFYGKHFFKK